MKRHEAARLGSLALELFPAKPGKLLFTCSFEPAESKVVCVLHNYRSLCDESGRGLRNLQSANDNLKSKFTGGIAQLVERQLCKLEVRGSNPLASSLRSRRRGERRLSRRSLGGGGHLFGLLHFSRELRLGNPLHLTTQRFSDLTN